MAAEIEKKLTEAGYKMLGISEGTEKLILDILKTKNTRYLKAIPFLVYKYKPDIARIEQNYRNISDDGLFNAIIAITARLFRESNIAGILPEHAEKEFGDNNTEKFGLDYGEFKTEFESQLGKEAPPLFIEKQKIYAERDLQMHLSILFTKKEKQIIRRLLEEKPISRTDYEYYSRKTKKKLGSIIGLQDFAKSLYAKTPKYDKDLFDLKKRLEKWLEENLGIKKASILNFSIFDHDKISISYKKKDKGYSEDQMFNTIKRLNDIKDEEILNLLNIYKEHNFR